MGKRGKEKREPASAESSADANALVGRSAGGEREENPVLEVTADGRDSTSETGFERVELDMPDAETAAKDGLGEDLSAIYEEDGDDIRPDMTRLERAPRLTVRRIVLGLLVFFAALAAISWMSFFIFSPRDVKFSGEKVSLTIDGPTAVKSGELVAFDIEYRNGESVPLGTAAIEIRLPDSFTLIGSEPAIDRNSWKLGSLPPRGRGKITITGIFLAPIGKELDIQAIASYRPADFNSEFQKVSTKTVVIDGSVLKIGISGHGKAMPGDTVDLTVTYENTSDNSFEDLVVRVEYPTGFIPESSAPAADDADISEWRVAGLGAKGIASITVTGTFASSAQGDIAVRAHIGFLDPSESFREQASYSFTTEVTQGQLVTALILNGKPESQAVRLGDTLRYAVTYRNTGSASLGNVEFSAVIEAEPASGLILWNGLEDGKDGRRDGGRITWTSKQVKSLERIEKDDAGVIEFSVPIADNAVGLGSGGFVVTCWVESRVESIDGDVINRRTRTEPIVAKVLSDTEVAARAGFYDGSGIPVGSGKIPPEVGETTTYRVYWTVDNSLHDLADLKLSAKLPDNVAWTGRSDVDAGDLRFDAADRKMVWTLNWMPTTVPTLAVSFDVSITPSDDQRDRIPTLVDATIFEAVDRVAGEKFIISRPPLSTALEDDPYGTGKGRVK